VSHKSKGITPACGVKFLINVVRQVKECQQGKGTHLLGSYKFEGIIPAYSVLNNSYCLIRLVKECPRWSVKGGCNFGPVIKEGAVLRRTASQ